MMNSRICVKRAATRASAVLLVLLLAFSTNATASVRIYINETCVVADEPVIVRSAGSDKIFGPSSSIIGQNLISGLIKGVARLIRSRSSRQDFSYSINEDLYLYTVDRSESPQPVLQSDLGCITVVSGSFSPDAATCSDDYQPLILENNDVSDEDIDQARENRPVEDSLRRANICLVDTVDSVFENKIELSEDHTAFRLRGAGYQVNSLLSAKKKNHRRAVLQTISLFEPSDDGRGGHLATSWINYGELTAGSRVSGAADTNLSGWTILPPLSSSVSRVYKENSRLQNAALDEAESLQRLVARQSHQVSALADQLETSPPTLRSGLQKEIDKLNIKIAVNEATLESWQAEYRGFPGKVYEYMPVTLRVTMTETKSEQRALLLLAGLLDENSKRIAERVAESD